MSEKLLKFMTSELTTLRIICQNEKCGSVIELRLSNVPKIMQDLHCPACNGSFFTGTQDYVTMLALALAGLDTVQKTVQVQFVIQARE